MARGQHSNRKADDDDPDHGDRGKESACLKAVGNELEHRHLKEDRVPEVPPQCGREPKDVLVGKRPVEPHLHPQCRNGLRGCQVAEHDRRRVARNQPDECEYQE